MDTFFFLVQRGEFLEFLAFLICCGCNLVSPVICPCIHTRVSGMLSVCWLLGQ